MLRPPPNIYLGPVFLHFLVCFAENDHQKREHRFLAEKGVGDIKLAKNPQFLRKAQQFHWKNPKICVEILVFTVNFQRKPKKPKCQTTSTKSHCFLRAGILVFLVLLGIYNEKRIFEGIFLRFAVLVHFCWFSQ